MSEREFDVMDELYFVAGYEALLASTGLGDADLKDTLRGLVEKGWAKCLRSADEEAHEAAERFDEEYRSYSYLATKEGLLAHNGM